MTTSSQPWSAAELRLALGRDPRPLDARAAIARLADERVLITGAQGSIGTQVTRILEARGGSVRPTDIGDLDVRLQSSVRRVFGVYRPTVVLHLAGAKHAPEGEVDPLSVLEVNATGTAHVVESAEMVGARVVTASTCKACDPETAYGASKLLAERLTLAAGGNVARFYNVVETAGNVFEIWDRIEPTERLPVTGCRRYFITLAEATALMLVAALAPHGRYTFDPGEARLMPEVAAALHPQRLLAVCPPRRGDRLAEPRHAVCEQVEPLGDGLERVWGPHDAFAGGRNSRPIAA